MSPSPLPLPAGVKSCRGFCCALLRYGMPYKNPEKRKEYQKQYRASHPGYYAEYNKRYCAENKESLAKLHREWRKKVGYKNPNNPNRKTWWKNRRDAGAKIIENVKLYYGCQNPACEWSGAFKSYCLDFHHVDRTTKKCSVALLTVASLKKLTEEISKCTVLCAICHRQVTWGDLDASKFKLCVVDSEGRCPK